MEQEGLEIELNVSYAGRSILVQAQNEWTILKVKQLLCDEIGLEKDAVTFMKLIYKGLLLSIHTLVKQ